MKTIKISAYVLLLVTIVGFGYNYGYNTASNKFRKTLLEQEQQLMVRLDASEKHRINVENQYIVELEELKTKKNKVRLEIREIIKKSDDKCLNTRIDPAILERLRNK